MSQNTSVTWSGAVNAPFRQLTTGVFIDFVKNLSTNNFFTINVSRIGSTDYIKGGGDSITFFDKYNYIDYTQYVTDWSVTRQIGQYPWGLIMAQADVRLDNTSKLFLPNYDATIGSGILPSRPMKISAGIGTESLGQFVGFTGQPELSIANRYMNLHAFDSMDYINNYAFTSSGTTYSGTLQNVTTSGVIGYYFGQLGFNNAQFKMDVSLQSPIGYVNVIDRKFGDVLKDLIEAEQGLLFTDENGIINFWNRQHIYVASGTGMKFSFNYSNISEIQYENTAIINDVTVVANPRKVQSSRNVYTSGTTQELFASGKTDIFVNFSDNDGALPVTSVTTPTAGVGASSYFDTNTAQDGSGTSGNSNITVSSTYLFGTTYKITFNNTATSSMWLTGLVIFGTPATVVETISQRFTDQTSVQNYGVNPSNNGDQLIINNDYIQDRTTALSLAIQLVSFYKDPRTHYTVRVFANPALQIGDYGYITIEDTGQTKGVFITGKKDILGQNAEYTQELVLEERGAVSWFTIGVSRISGNDTIAP